MRLHRLPPLAPLFAAALLSPACSETPAVTPADMAAAATPDLLAGPDLQKLPAPVIDEVFPTAGPTTGGTLITINGKNFFDDSVVLVDGKPAGERMRTSPTQLRARTPARPGKPASVEIRVVNADGQGATAASPFHYQTSTVEFGAAKTVASGGMNDIYAGAVTDLDKDGRADLVLCIPLDHAVAVLPGQAGGGFGAPSMLPEPQMQQPLAVAAGDLDGDGYPDLATVEPAPSLVMLRMNDKNRGFKAPGGVTLPAMSAPAAIAAGDWNGDGKLDLATSNRKGLSVTMLLGRGDGTLQVLKDAALTGPYPAAIAAGRFDKGATLDLAVGDVQGTSVSLLPGAGDGTFGAEARLDAGTVTSVLAAGDLDGNGLDDLVVPAMTEVRVMLASDGGFGKPQAAAPVHGAALALADVNLDGILDLVAAVPSSSNIQVFLGKGDGGFQMPPIPILIPVDGRWLAAVDLDGDGLADVVASNGSSVQVARNASR